MSQKSNVIGPFDRADWLTMIMLKRSIQYMKELNDNKYLIRINAEKDNLKKMFSMAA